ncbi:MAG: hypothetical protein KKH92_05990 [Firmicutes bacterium]|nr:hypothetical protein [Bacillota bacterium]
MLETESRCYNREIITSDEKVLTVYFMLEARQRVSYDTFYEIFGASRRTFNRVIATIRKSLENCSIYETQIIYNRDSQNYELVKACLRG